jgi:hypothetical protein
MLPLRKENDICRLTYSPTTTYQNNIFGPDHPEYLSEYLLFQLPSPIHQDLNHFRQLTNNAHDDSSTRSSRLCYSDGNIHPAAHCSSKQGSYAPAGAAASSAAARKLGKSAPPAAIAVAVQRWQRGGGGGGSSSTVVATSLAAEAAAWRKHDFGGGDNALGSAAAAWQWQSQTGW